MQWPQQWNKVIRPKLIRLQTRSRLMILVGMVQHHLSDGPYLKASAAFLQPEVEKACEATVN
jgi:hypothetical protein